MPEFSPDPVLDFCVAEAVVRAGQEQTRELNEAAKAANEKNDQITGHRDRAEQLGML